MDEMNEEEIDPEKFSDDLYEEIDKINHYADKKQEQHKSITLTREKDPKTNKYIIKEESSPKKEY